MSEYKYTDDGRKVIVVGALNAQQSIVQEIYVSGDQEIPSGENFVVSNLHDEPVESWKEKRLREIEERYENGRERMERDFQKEQKRLSEAREKAKLQANALFAFAKNSDEEQLERLWDFLAGEITHFFLGDRCDPKIVTWDDDALYQCDRWGGGGKKIEDIKLISLMGRSKGDLAFRLHQYSDGSGGSQEVIPCRSYEEALQEAQSALDEIAANYVENGRSFFNPEKWQQIEGIVIPERALQKHREEEEQRRKERIDKLKQELSDLGGL